MTACIHNTDQLLPLTLSFNLLKTPRIYVLLLCKYTPSWSHRLLSHVTWLYSVLKWFRQRVDHVTKTNFQGLHSPESIVKKSLMQLLQRNSKEGLAKCFDMMFCKGRYRWVCDDYILTTIGFNFDLKLLRYILDFSSWGLCPSVCTKRGAKDAHIAMDDQAIIKTGEWDIYFLSNDITAAAPVNIWQLYASTLVHRINSGIHSKKLTEILKSFWRIWSRIFICHYFYLIYDGHVYIRMGDYNVYKKEHTLLYILDWGKKTGQKQKNTVRDDHTLLLLILFPVRLARFISFTVSSFKINDLLLYYNSKTISTHTRTQI